MKHLNVALTLLTVLAASQAHARTFTTLIQFTGTSGTANGSGSTCSLTVSGTKLYGFTDEGGTGGGNLFSAGIDGSGYQNLVSFTGIQGPRSGDSPWFEAPLLSGTKVYGLTAFGGSNNNGNLFIVGTNGSGFQNLLSFSGGTGGNLSYGGLTLSGTKFYAVTNQGGAGRVGNVFSVGTDGSGYQNLLSFTGNAAPPPARIPGPASP